MTKNKKYSGEIEENYSGSMDTGGDEVDKQELANYPKELKTVKLTFTGNRSYELHIGREIYRFNGRESKDLPVSVLDHKDFTDIVRQKFVIGEMK